MYAAIVGERGRDIFTINLKSKHSTSWRFVYSIFRFWNETVFHVYIPCLSEINNLVAAITNGSEEVIRILIVAGASIDAQNAFGNSPLHAAARAGKIDIVKLLLGHGANPNVMNHRGSTPLHICAALSSDTDEENKIFVDIASTLLSNKGAKTMVDCCDVNGYTPLHFAAQRGCNNMISLLVDSGANVGAKTTVDEKGRGGRTPYSIAKISHKVKAMNLLETFGSESIKNWSIIVCFVLIQFICNG
jgi:ankyrin repeat protein